MKMKRHFISSQQLLFSKRTKRNERNRIEEEEKQGQEHETIKVLQSILHFK